MKTCLVLKNITKTYEKKDEVVKALDGVSYQFEYGKLYAIMGHSGSGKSTLISILGLLDAYSSGEYLFNQKNVSELTEKDLASLRKNNIGFIFQDYYLDEQLKAYENVMVPMLINENINKNERKTKALQLLEKLNISQRKNHFPKELSGGEQQRIAIARALANNPNVILADEPTGNLDEENEKMVFQQLQSMAKDGKCVIVVSHSPLIKEYADTLLMIKNGKLAD